MSTAMVLAGRRGGQRQLVKRRHGSNIPLIVDLPTAVGRFPARLLRDHLPKFYHDFRESGNRVAMPFEHFRPSFQRAADGPLHSVALDWVFSRVQDYGAYASRYSYRPPPGANPMGRLLDDLDDACQIGDVVSAQNLAEKAVNIFDAISNVIRPDRGFDYSDQLFEEFLETARLFLPYLNAVDPSMSYMFYVLESVWRAGLQDLTPIEILLRSVGPNEQAMFAAVAYGQIQADGNLFAWDMANNGLI